MQKLLAKLALTSMVLSSVLVAVPAQAATTWNTTGNYVISFDYMGSPYNHDLTLVQDGSGNITGTGGGYPAGGSYVYQWVIDSGTVSGNSISFTAHYTASADAVNPLTVMHVNGTIASDGSISGNWDDNYQGGYRTGTFVTLSGAAVNTPVTVSCPANTTKNLVETVLVPATQDTDVLSNTSLVNGETYILKAKGTADAGDNITFDARYSFRSTSSTMWTDAVSTYESYGPTLLDLLVNGTTPWGDYNSSHEYETSMVGTGAPVAFRINDVYAVNNTGSLSVEIYSCDPVVVPTVPTKDQCKKDGYKNFIDPRTGKTFKNQGQCVSYVEHL